MVLPSVCIGKGGLGPGPESPGIVARLAPRNTVTFGVRCRVAAPDVGYWGFHRPRWPLESPSGAAILALMNRQHEKTQSSILGQEMEYLWFGDRGRAVILLPTSAGRYNENEDFGLVGALESKIDAGEIQVISLDAINRESWADDDLHPSEKLRRHELYDRFLAEEFLPMVAARAGRSDPVLYGASLGGWQAATFGARHPELVGRVVALSGFFTLEQLTDGWWSEACYFFSPEHFVPNMDAEWVQRLSQVGWVIATGENDTLVDETRNFSRVLRDKGIPVHEEVWPGVFGHDWPFWKQHLPRFVP